MEAWLQSWGSLCLLVAGFLYGINCPVPLGLLLLAAGGLAREGVLSWTALLIATPLGIFLGEQPWFFLGRRLGPRLLYRLAWWRRDRDTLVPRLIETFQRHGPSVLLTGRFVPGIPATVVPLAGMTGVSWPRFFAWDMASALLYTTVYAWGGHVLSRWFRPLEVVGLAVAAFLALYLVRKPGGAPSSAENEPGQHAND